MSNVGDALAAIKSRRLEVSEEGLKQLAEYKYKAGAYTPLDDFLNAYLWVPVSDLLPSWLAPNAITLLGLAIMASGAGVVSYFSPDLKASAPNWAYLWCSWSIVVYQTLDAIDGKQARKTGSSSPLGQLFDHGCDSASTTLLCLMGATSLRMGFGRAVICLFACQLPFWLAQWAEYHTHVLSTALGGVAGVTEAQLIFAFIPLVNIAFPGFWQTDLGIPLPHQCCASKETCSLRAHDILLAAQLMGTVACSTSSVLEVLTCSEKACRKNYALLQTVPIFMFIVLGCAWAVVLPRAHPRLALLSLGVSFTYVTCKMIVAAMSQTEYQTVHTIIVPLPLLFLVTWFDVMPRHEEVLLGSYAAFVVYKTYRYIRNVIEELSHYLGIYTFKLGPRNGCGAQSSSSPGRKQE